MLLSLKQKEYVRLLLPLLLMLVSVSLVATDKANFSIRNENPNQIDLHFNLGDWALETNTENSIEHKIVRSNAKNMLYIDETETLPVYSAMIAIPDGMDVELVTDVTRSQSINSVNLITRDIIHAERGQEDTYPSRQIVISEPGQFRDFRVVNLNIYPFQYDTKNNDLKVMQNADISLRFVPTRDSYVNQGSGFYSASFHKIYDALILNYDNLRDEAVPFVQPRLLIIYPYTTDNLFLNKFDEFVTWKKQKGYIVDVASTAAGEAGNTTTTIKDYIQTRYNNISTRPDVLLLIGDTSGSFIIPYYSSDDGDYPYTLLAGPVGDNYQDVQIGRISVETTTQFNNYVKRVMQYERDINPDTAQWLNRMLLVADNSPSGISTEYNNEYVYDISLAVNPDYTYTKLYSGAPSAAEMNQAINIGVGFFNYRGYLGMSGWSPGSSLVNGNKLNHGVFITCSTSTFYSGVSTTESYLRLGSETLPYGGITATGMATSSTHTGFNNCLTGGIYDGIFNHGMRSMGEATMFSRNYLITVYGTQATSLTNNFIRYLNLIGDATAEVWVTIPKAFNVTSPTRIIAGTPQIEIIVKDTLNEPVSGASVNLWQEASALNLTSYTNSLGRVVFDIPTDLTDVINATVSKHDFKPNEYEIRVSGTGLVYYDSVIDDDNVGGSSGNNNQTLNAGETVDLYLQVSNSSEVSVDTIDTIVSINDPYVQIVSGASMLFPIAGAGSIVTSSTPVRLQISPDCPDEHPVVFTTDGNCSLGNWTTTFQLIVSSPDLDYVSHTITGNNSYLEVGETTSMYISVFNNGAEQATGVYGRLRSLNNYVSITDSLKYFGNVASGSSYSNSANPFTINASSTAIVGMIVQLELYLYNASGYNDTELFTLTIGNPIPSVTDPLGQDAYGYFIYDMGDSAYPQCPTYDWIGIAPAEGGSGTLLAINDPRNSGNEGDQVGSTAGQVVSLPFTFRFYGIEYNQITVVSNGFLAFGITNNYDFRNWRIPGAIGPNAMIAPFWDDLTTDGGGGIYVYHDTANHRYIIEWYNMKNGSNGTSEETFQVILFNPAHYPTSTSDGPIKIQYKVFNNVDNSTTITSHGCYSTIGIKDHTGLDGLEYSFNNAYPATALPLTNQSALYITTAEIPPDAPFLSITQVTLLDTNGNGIAEPGETLDVRLTISNAGSEEASNVNVTISESDPWISISGNSASFGNIPALGTAINTSGLTVNVLPNTPNGYSAVIDAVITSSGYTFYRSFSITIHTPVLGFGNIIIQDFTGNSNGSLDPGETATIIIPLNNTGGVTSESGNAVLTCSTNGVTVNEPSNVSFGAIAAGGSINLSFSVTASPDIPIGTLASLVFNATAGIYSANKNQPVEIGAPHEIIIGSGTSSQTYPLDRYYNYSVHESIYLASEMESSSTIKSIAFYKDSGTDVNEILPVTIYMKHTTDSSLASGAYSTAGFTQVYNGGFLNNAISGWMEVNLDTMFDYNGVSNLQILIIKGNQQWISGYPQWRYSAASPARARQERSDYSQPTELTASNNLPNIRFKVFPTIGVLYPPQNLTAYPSHQSVRLEWGIPVTGTPTGYKIFKNGSLLTTVTALFYTDLAVTNGISYSYYLKAVYSEGESDATATVNATPNALPPSNLTASAGNGLVNLFWDAASGRADSELRDTGDRTISAYKIYRDGSPVTTTTETSYQDTGLTNGVTYSYYVTTVYINPTGESGPSNSVEATPNLINFATIGTGTSSTANNIIGLNNLTYKSVHGQAVYTAAELNAAGIFGPVSIVQVGFFTVSQPNLPLANFIIRMKHTTDTNVTNWQSADNMITVYTDSAYMPSVGEYDMLSFTTPFLWNGTDNLVIDTAFGIVAEWSYSGTWQYTSVTSGYRRSYSDTENQTNVFTGGSTTYHRPNIKLAIMPVNLAAPEVSIEKVTQGVRLFWPAVDGATRYKIQGSFDPDSGFSQIVEISATEYIDTVANPYRFYRVIATDSVAAGRNH